MKTFLKDPDLLVGGGELGGFLLGLPDLLLQVGALSLLGLRVLLLQGGDLLGLLGLGGGQVLLALVEDLLLLFHYGFVGGGERGEIRSAEVSRADIGQAAVVLCIDCGRSVHGGRWCWDRAKES